MKKLDIFDKYTTPSRWKQNALKIPEEVNEKKNEIRVNIPGFKMGVVFAAIAVIICCGGFLAIFRQKPIPHSTTSSSTESIQIDVKTLPSDFIITGENLLSGVTVNQLLQFGGNQYEMTTAKFCKSAKKNMYRCNSFPEYTFRNDGTHSKNVTEVNLYEGALINDNYKVGMTYNEISSKVGGNIKIYYTDNDVEYCSYIVINGKTWSFEFELTDEQKSEIHSRMIKKAGSEEAFNENYDAYGVDISDINPRSITAGYNSNDYNRDIQN